MLILWLLCTALATKCSNRIDRYTSLSGCELAQLNSKIREYEKTNPPDAEIDDLDSMVAYHDSLSAYLDAQRFILLRDYKFKTVCSVCYENHLSCGNRKAGSLEFTCINEGRFQK